MSTAASDPVSVLYAHRSVTIQHVTAIAVVDVNMSGPWLLAEWTSCVTISLAPVHWQFGQFVPRLSEASTGALIMSHGNFAQMDSKGVRSF